MSEIDYIDEIDDKAIECDYIDIAKTLFNKSADSPCTKQILFENSGCDTSSVFELLLNIFMEGIMILYDNLNNFDLKDFKEDHVLKLQPWINSIGFKISINKIGIDDLVAYTDYYCKIATRNHEQYKMYFDDDVKKYVLLLNPIYSKECKIYNLSDFYTLLIINDNVYIIKFNLYNF